ncbi:MAG: L,D-transpeptidase family protein [Sphingomicrobium sp.]
MSNKMWIGAAVALALCSTALASCSQGGSSTGQNQSASQQAAGAPLAWNKKAEQQLRDAIEKAPANGLKPELFLKEGEKGAALTEAALKYASALANGYSDPKSLHEVYTIPRSRIDVRQGLAQAIQKGDVKGWLESLVPQTDEYRALSQAHLHYLQLAANGQPQPIPDGKPIKPGRHDARIPLVRAALAATEIIGPRQQPAQKSAAGSAAHAAPAPRADQYSRDLVAAVKKVQAEWGLKPDGVIGGVTLDALNAGPAYRARQLAIAMERLRWLPRTPPPTRMDVNTAASLLDYWRDGQHVDRREVVEGEPDKPTPQLQAPIVRLVANPTWNVPEGIGVKELSTKSARWLADNGYVQKDGKWVQLSGPKNSLGLVKFDMDDKEAIYLHDTPAKALFTLPERHRSHGCVRVQNAVQFATSLAEEQGILDQFQQAMSQNDEKFIKLKTPIPVRLIYQTAFWDGSAIRFRPDVYGWDDNIAKALGLAPGVPIKIEQPESSDDIGP